MELPEFYSPDVLSEPLDDESWKDLAGQIEAAAIQFGRERRNTDGWVAAFEIDDRNTLICRRITEDSEENQDDGLFVGMYLDYTTVLVDNGEDENGYIVQKNVTYGMPFDEDPFVMTEIEVWNLDDDGSMKSYFGDTDITDHPVIDRVWEEIVDTVIEWSPLGKAEMLDAYQLLMQVNFNNSVDPENLSSE